MLCPMNWLTNKTSLFIFDFQEMWHKAEIREGGKKRFPVLNLNLASHKR